MYTAWWMLLLLVGLFMMLFGVVGVMRIVWRTEDVTLEFKTCYRCKALVKSEFLMDHHEWHWECAKEEAK